MNFKDLFFHALSFRIMWNYNNNGSSFVLSFSSYYRCLPSNGKGLARDFAAEKERERVEAPAPAIDSLEIPWFQKLLSPAHTLGVSPVANRSSTADKVLARFLLWSRQVGKDFVSLLSARDRIANRIFSNTVSLRANIFEWNCIYVREFGLSISIANFVQRSERLVSARAYIYIYIFIWLK